MTPSAEEKILAELAWLRSVIEPLIPLVDKYTRNPAAKWRARRAVQEDRPGEVQEPQRPDLHEQAG